MNEKRRLRAVADALEKWFAVEQRQLPWRRRYDPYEVWVSEVMLQQTRMEVVLPRFAEFIERFPSVAALAAASEEEVLAAWSGLGYYRRARMLREGAIAVVRDFGGVIPRDAKALRSITGVGRYTAGAIASIAFGLREPLVDGNVARVVSRIEAIEDPLGSTSSQRRLWDFAARLVEQCGSPRALNQSLMELGAVICKPAAPLCEICPVAKYCEARRSGRVGVLPVAKGRREAVDVTIPLYVWTDDRGRVLMLRPDGPLMRGMVHLPHGSGELIPELRVGCGRHSELLGTVRHTVTHRRIRFDVFRVAGIDARALHDGTTAEWIAPAELDRYPHPSYVRKALRVAGLLSF